VLEKKRKDNIKIVLLIMYQVVDWIQLTQDNIHFSDLTGVEKFRFLTLQIRVLSLPSNNCFFSLHQDVPQGDYTAVYLAFACLSVRLREQIG
jgi:hypothetical protein